MEDTTAVLDSPELEDAGLENEGGDEGSLESGEQGESHESSEQQESQDEPAVIEADGKLKLSGKALETLNKLKAENPKQAREFRAALFDAAALKKEFPEGIREAVALKQELEEIGGMEAVGTMRGELYVWKGLDADWVGNKPQFAAEMADSNPEAFAFHAPHVMNKFAEVDPDGFSYQVSRVFAQDMAANNVSLTMERMKDFLVGEDGKVKPGMEGVARQWQALATYMDRVNGLAKNPPKTKEVTKNAGNLSEVEQREQALTVREFGTERNAVKSAISTSEYKKNLGNRKISDEKVSTIGELYEASLNRAVQATPNHKATVDRYVAAKDKAGYRKYMNGLISKAAPIAMAAAFRRAGIGDKPGPKKVEVKPGTVKPVVAVTTGFNRVGTKPSHNDVDWQSTARIPGKKGGDGKYIMRDGSKVLFQR